MPYHVVIPKSVAKQIIRLPQKIRVQVIKEVQALQNNPRPHGCIKLKGYQNEYRIRIGDYRVWYEVRDEESVVEILRCLNRKDVYRD
jgi:mRNA interferase RelE/StbE